MAVGIEHALKECGIAGQVLRIGSLMTLFFTGDPIRNYEDARKSDTRRFAAFFRAMLDRGVLLAPSQFEAAFVSAAHSESDISVTATACLDALREMQKRGTSA
jgi:glutamate-1-semialdehyde 2,1-aminomutase